MKKAGSILVAIALMFGSLAVLFAFHAPSVGAQPPLIYRFNSESALSDLKMGNTSSVKTFDADEQAAKITVQSLNTGGNTVRFEANWQQQEKSCDTYPYFAIRLKLSNANMKAHGLKNFQFRTSANTSNNVQVDLPFSANTEWQTAVVNLSEAPDGDYWKYMLVKMLKDETLAAGDTVHIRWMGFFESPQAVSAYEALDPSPLIYRYGSEASLSKLYVNNQNSEASYDAAEQAAKLTVKTVSTGGNTIRLAPLWSTDYANSCANYPYFAIKLKLGSTQIKAFSNANFQFRTSAVMDNSYNIQKTKPFEQNTEWQIVIIDLSGAPAEQSWKAMLMKMLDDSTLQTGDTVHIKWMGFFKSTDAVNVYDGQPPAVSSAGSSSSGASSSGTSAVSSAASSAASSQPAPSLVYRYDSAASLSTLTLGNANSVKSFDADAQAAKLTVQTPLSGGGTVRFEINWPKVEGSCGTHPYFAIKFKLSDARMEAYNLKNFQFRTSENTANNVQKDLPIAKTAEWQTVVLDLSEAPPGDYWKYMLVKMLEHTTLQAGDTVHIKWMGFFQSRQAVTDYDDVPPVSSTPVSSTPVSSTPASSSAVSSSVSSAASSSGTVSQPTAESLIYRFNSEASLSKLVVGNTNSAKSYDAEQQAAVVTVKTLATGGNTVRLNPTWAASPGSCDSHPYFAIRMKLSDERMSAFTNMNFQFRTSAVSDTSYNVQKTQLFGETTEWQTVIVNLSGSSPGNNWTAMLSKMFDDTTLQVGDTVSIRWMGFFESEQAVKAYAVSQNDDSGYDPSEVNPLLYVFDKESSLSKITVGNTKSAKSFDAEEKAAKLTVNELDTGGNTIRLNLAWPEVAGSCGSHKFFALRVKLSASRMTAFMNMNFQFRTSAVSDNTYDVPKTAVFAPNTEWQTVIINLSGASSEKYWKYMLVKMLEDTTLQAGDTVHIKWMGFFPSEQAVKDYAGDTGDPSDPDNGETLAARRHYSLKTADNISRFITWSPLDDVRVSFDSAAGAMKVETVDAASGPAKDGQLSTNAGRFRLNMEPMACASYPVAALRVKLKTPVSKAGWLSFITDDPITEVGMGAFRPEYAETSEWQTLIFDFSHEENGSLILYEGKWKALLVDMALNNFASENDIFWVEDISFFTTVAAAKAYTGLADNSGTASGDTSENPDPGPSTGEALPRIWPLLILGLGAAAAFGAHRNHAKNRKS